jgi:hypothetical protein
LIIYWSKYKALQGGEVRVRTKLSYGCDKPVLDNRSRSTEVAQHLKQISDFGEPTNKHIINKGSSKKNTHF